MLLAERIERISYMECCCDLLLNAYHADPETVFEDLCLRHAWSTLRNYYENGQWMEDFQCDERGELPAGLKRGILSEDTLYDLFSKITDEQCTPRELL